MPRGRPGLSLVRGAAPAAVPLLGGAALALALPVPGLWPLGWLALAPVVSAADSRPDGRRAALAAWLGGFGFHAVALHWIYLTCRFARVPVPVSILAWAALAAFLALAWAVVALLVRRLALAWPRTPRPLIWAIAWTAVAAAAERWTPRLGADLLGYTQFRVLPLVQASAWGGPHLLGFVLVLFNASLAARSRRGLWAAAAIGLTLTCHGAFELRQRPNSGPTLRVEVLQPNIDQYAKWDDSRVDEIVANYEELLARPRVEKPALVVWPETALPFRASRAAPLETAAKWAKRVKAPQLVGVLVRPEGDDGPANAAHLVTPEGKVEGLYAKRELVPFGEFVPLRGWIPRFVIDHGLAVLDDLGEISAGARLQPLVETAWGPTAVTICYEAVFPRWSRLDAARGAKLLVNVTNDGWYKDTWGPHQHFVANLFRAVETRLPVVRAGNTGISAVIDPWGVVTASLPLGTRGRLDASLPAEDFFPERSFYVRHGDWLGMLCFGLSVLGALLPKGRKR